MSSADDHDHVIGHKLRWWSWIKPVQFPSVLRAVSESESCEDSLPFIKGHSLLQLPKQFYLRSMLMMRVLVIGVVMMPNYFFISSAWKAYYSEEIVFSLIETWKLMRSMFAWPGCSSIVSRSRIEGHGRPRVSPNWKQRIRNALTWVRGITG